MLLCELHVNARAEKAALSHAGLTNDRAVVLTHRSDVTCNAGTLTQVWIFSHMLRPCPSKSQLPLIIFI